LAGAGDCKALQQHQPFNLLGAIGPWPVNAQSARPGLPALRKSHLGVVHPRVAVNHSDSPGTERALEEETDDEVFGVIDDFRQELLEVKKRPWL
jgi:hypothetical protein